MLTIQKLNAAFSKAEILYERAVTDLLLSPSNILEIQSPAFKNCFDRKINPSEDGIVGWLWSADVCEDPQLSDDVAILRVSDDVFSDIRISLTDDPGRSSEPWVA